MRQWFAQKFQQVSCVTYNNDVVVEKFERPGQKDLKYIGSARELSFLKEVHTLCAHPEKIINPNSTDTVKNLQTEVIHKSVEYLSKNSTMSPSEIKQCAQNISHRVSANISLADIVKTLTAKDANGERIIPIPKGDIIEPKGQSIMKTASDNTGSAAKPVSQNAGLDAPLERAQNVPSPAAMIERAQSAPQKENNSRVSLR